MQFKARLILGLGCCGFSVLALADILELKNGTVLNGTYAGGTPTAMRFNTAAGAQVVETPQIVALIFTAHNAASTASNPAPATALAATPAAAATPAPATQRITLPAGTQLLVRLMDSISSKNKPGTPFTTKLEYDLGTSKGVALKAGTTIYGRIQSSTEARRATGRSTLDLRLTQVVVNGQPLPMTTSSYQEAGQASVAKAAKGAGAGAAIGAIAGDAGKGAAIGAAGGALVRGQTVTITPGTLLEFTLTQPVTVPSAP